MDVYSDLAKKIISAQENIVGPVAYEQAKKVQGIRLGKTLSEIAIDGNKKEVLEHLVKQYEGIFGKASLEVCKSAAHGIPKDQLPPLLQ